MSDREEIIRPDLPDRPSDTGGVEISVIYTEPDGRALAVRSDRATDVVGAPASVSDNAQKWMRRGLQVRRAQAEGGEGSQDERVDLPTAKIARVVRAMRTRATGDADSGKRDR